MNNFSRQAPLKISTNDLSLSVSNSQKIFEIQKRKLIRIPLDIKIKIHKIAQQMYKERISKIDSKQSNFEQKKEVEEPVFQSVSLMRGQAENKTCNRDLMQKYYSLRSPCNKISAKPEDNASSAKIKVSNTDEIAKEIEKIIWASRLKQKIIKDSYNLLYPPVKDKQETSLEKIKILKTNKKTREESFDDQIKQQRLQVLKEKCEVLKKEWGIKNDIVRQKQMPIQVSIPSNQSSSVFQNVSRKPMINNNLSLPYDKTFFKEAPENEEKMFNKSELMASRLDKICDILENKQNRSYFKETNCNRAECPIEETKPAVNVAFGGNVKTSRLPNSLESLKFEQVFKGYAVSDNITRLPPINKIEKQNKKEADKQDIKSVRQGSIIELSAEIHQPVKFIKQFNQNRHTVIMPIKPEPRKVIKSILNEHLLKSKLISNDSLKSIKMSKNQSESLSKKSTVKTIKLIKSKNDVPLPKLLKPVKNDIYRPVVVSVPTRNSEKRLAKYAQKSRKYEKTVSTDTTIYKVPIKTIMPQKKKLFENKENYYEIASLIYQTHNNLKVYSGHSANNLYSTYSNNYFNPFYSKFTNN